MLMQVSEMALMVLYVSLLIVAVVYILNIIFARSKFQLWPFILFALLVLSSNYIGELKDQLASKEFPIEKEVLVMNDGVTFQAGVEEGYMRGYFDGKERTIKIATVTEVTDEGYYIKYDDEEHYYTW